MSIKKLFLVSFVGFICGSILISAYDFHAKMKREPASEMGRQKPILDNSNHKFKISGKVGSLMSVYIDAMSPIPDRNDQELTLKATIQLNGEAPTGLHYKWMLPQGVAILYGQTEDTFQNVEINQTIEVQVTVTGLSKESAEEPVLFHVETDVNGAHVASTGVYSTKPSDLYFENDSDESAATAAANTLTKPSAGQKVMQMPPMRGVQF